MDFERSSGDELHLDPPAPPPSQGQESRLPQALLLLAGLAVICALSCTCRRVCRGKRQAATSTSDGWSAPQKRMLSKRMPKSDDSRAQTTELAASSFGKSCPICGGFGCWKCQPGIKPPSARNAAVPQQYGDARRTLALHPLTGRPMPALPTSPVSLVGGGAPVASSSWRGWQHKV